MDKGRIGIFILLISLLLVAGLVASPNSASVVYVDTDGSGDFNCDGVDDQVQIQKALDMVASNPGITTVYLSGPNTYWISDNIHVGDNTILEGDPDAIIKLVDNAGWPAWKDLIEEKDSSNGNHDITIRGFEIDGNSANQPEKLGRGYYGLIQFDNAYNIEVYDMYLHDAHGDGLMVTGKPGSQTNIKFYNNRVERMGHEGLYVTDSTYIDAYNNDIVIRTNSGLRVDRSNHVKFYNNKITTVIGGDSTGPGIEVQHNRDVVMDDIEIYNNLIYNLNGAGIWLFSTSSNPMNTAVDVHIHNNIIYDVSQYRIGLASGVLVQGFHNTIIENNVFDGVHRAAISYQRHPKNPTTLTGFVTFVSDNIIVDTRQIESKASSTGFAISNGYNGHSFISTNNCIYNNAGGNYRGNNILPKGDIYVDPLFVDAAKHDYRLKADSPCIGMGAYDSLSGSSVPGLPLVLGLWT